MPPHGPHGHLPLWETDNKQATFLNYSTRFFIRTTKKRQPFIVWNLMSSVPIFIANRLSRVGVGGLGIPVLRLGCSGWELRRFSDSIKSGIRYKSIPSSLRNGMSLKFNIVSESQPISFLFGTRTMSLGTSAPFNRTENKSILCQYRWLMTA